MNLLSPTCVWYSLIAVLPGLASTPIQPLAQHASTEQHKDRSQLVSALQIAERCAPHLELQHNSRDFATGIESVRFTVIRGSDFFMLVPTPSGRLIRCTARGRRDGISERHADSLLRPQNDHRTSFDQLARSQLKIVLSEQIAQNHEDLQHRVIDRARLRRARSSAGFPLRHGGSTCRR